MARASVGAQRLDGGGVAAQGGVGPSPARRLGAQGGLGVDEQVRVGGSGPSGAAVLQLGAPWLPVWLSIRQAESHWRRVTGLHICSLEVSVEHDMTLPSSLPVTSAMPLWVQRQAFRAAMNEHRQLVPGEDATSGNLVEASPASRTPWRDALLQHLSRRSPHRRRSSRSPLHDIEHEAGG